MFIKGKPIRFGYKYWCLASTEGYLYQYIPYAGASEQEDSGFGLGERVVLSLLSHVMDRAKHTVTFDNFFTSHKLKTRLSNEGFFALGTVRDNRTNLAPLMGVKEMRKKPRGTSDFCFDTNNSIVAVRWNDNAVVTLLSNFLSHTPMTHAKRYDRKQRKMVTIDQPHLVNQYNHRMGGVDLFDNAISNYRIRVRGKKWYWPLITNALDAAMVNAWKLHCLCRKYEKKLPMRQYDFRVEVCESIMNKTSFHHPGRPSTSSGQLSRRYDRIDHFIGKLDTRHRCPQCGGKTEFGCLKCKTNLHPAPCFLDYHNGVAPDKAKITKAQ